MPTKKEKQPLSVTHPELAKEASDWDPAVVTAGSSRKLSWKCSVGHKWETSPKHRSKGTGCPICSGQKILTGFNDLRTTHPRVAIEANGWDPSSSDLVFSRKYNWKCSSGHTWDTTIVSRKRGSGCPSCAGVRVTSGENDLLTNFPDLAKELIDSDAVSLSVTSRKKVRWKCPKGHEFLASVGDRTRGQGCGVCAGKQIQIGVNDLSTTDPEVAREAYGWNPCSITRSSNKKVMWKCEFQHTWLSTPNNRISQNSGCPICSGKSLLIGFNDLSSKFPLLAKEAYGWDPSTVLSGSNLRKKWICSLGHLWETQINMRVSQQTGCPICSGHKLKAGFNDLHTTHPELAKEADGWDPSKLSAGTHNKLGWTCDLGHKWEAAVNSRASGVGCPICKNKKLLVDYNDLKTTHPELAKQADGWDPTQIIAGSNKKQNWKCALGHKWSAAPNKRAYGERGCPSCANTSFDPNIDGWIYLVANEEWEMLKIGITNFPKNRVTLHLSRNWELMDLRGPMEGHLVQKWERAIIQMLSKKGADLSNPQIAGKFDGYTEAWSKSTFDVTSIMDLMSLTEEFEGDSL